MSLTNNRLIVKNSIYLYARTIVTLLISLYTSRVFLRVLGVVDLGIYNVVGGVVIMLSFSNTMMAAGTQRFLSYEIGKDNNPSHLQRLFSMLVFIHILVALILLLFAETMGLWFFHNKLVIPEDRQTAAMWAYQFSVVSAVINISQVPYNASIIAHEKMDAFAYIAIFQTIAKLFVIYVAMIVDYDKLIIVSLLNLIVIIIITFIYRFYCRKKFEECVIKFHWDTALFKTLVSYSGWNFFGSISNVIADQGINILCNLFFGPTINASRAIAIQVKSALTSFVSNFQTAFNPQIIKSYAGDNYSNMKFLIEISAKYSFLLLALFAFPILLETRCILRLWLDTIPSYAVEFCQLILVNACIDCLSGPLITAIQATGKIKIYQLTVSTILILTFPVSYIILFLYQIPESPYYVSIFASCVLLMIRIFLVDKEVRISLWTSYKIILYHLFLSLLPSIIFAIIIDVIMEDGIYRFLTNVIVSIVCLIISTYVLGMSKAERKYVKKYVKKLAKKKITKA